MSQRLKASLASLFKYSSGVFISLDIGEYTVSITKSAVFIYDFSMNVIMQWKQEGSKWQPPTYANLADKPLCLELMKATSRVIDREELNEGIASAMDNSSGEVLFTGEDESADRQAFTKVLASLSEHFRCCRDSKNGEEYLSLRTKGNKIRKDKTFTPDFSNLPDLSTLSG